MSMLQLIGGVLLVAVAIVIIVSVTAQETKGGLGTIAGESSGSFYDKNRGKTKEAMLVRISAISGIALVVLTLALAFV